MADTALTVPPAGPAPLALSPVQERLLDAFLAGRRPATIRAYQQDLADFAVFVRVADAEEAIRRLLATPQGDANGIALAYKADMVRRELAPATVNRRLSALRSVVQLGNHLALVSWQLAVENVDRAAYRDTRGPGRDGVRALIDQAKVRGDDKGVRDQAVLRLLHDTGLRRGEVVGLDLEHVDLAAPAVWILGKGRSEREPITLPPPTRQALEAWLARRGGAAGPLFIALDHAHAGQRMSGEAVRLIVKQLGAAVGVTARPHGLRHTAITEVLERNGGDVRKAQRFSRHRDVRTLELYDDNRQDLGGEMAKLIAEE